jgi:hypothetical protein
VTGLLSDLAAACEAEIALQARLNESDILVTDSLQVSARTCLALLAVAEAADPFARRPFPVSADERDEWRVAQQRLVDALAALEASS